MTCKLSNDTCGSHTLEIDDDDAVCFKCGYRIKNYKELKREMGEVQFKKFERGLKK